MLVQEKFLQSFNMIQKQINSKKKKKKIKIFDSEKVSF